MFYLSLAYLNIDDKRKQGDELRRQITELDMIREQYNILKKEYEVCVIFLYTHNSSRDLADDII